MTDHSENRRRGDDPRIDKLVQDVDELKEAIKANTEITTQVKEAVASFKLIATVSKWITIVIAAFIAVKTGLVTLLGGKNI